MYNDHKQKNSNIMKRKEFLQTGLATSALMGSSVWASASEAPGQNEMYDQSRKKALVPWGYHVDYEAVRIERPKEGKPHQGKVLMAIQPHSDDIPLSAGVARQASPARRGREIGKGYRKLLPQYISSPV